MLLKMNSFLFWLLLTLKNKYNTVKTLRVPNTMDLPTRTKNMKTLKLLNARGLAETVIFIFNILAITTIINMM